MEDTTKAIGALFASLFLVAIVTAFVLPNRPSPAVIKAFFAGLTGAIRSTLGLSATTSTSIPSGGGGGGARRVM